MSIKPEVELSALVQACSWLATDQLCACCVRRISCSTLSWKGKPDLLICFRVSAWFAILNTILIRPYSVINLHKTRQSRLNSGGPRGGRRSERIGIIRDAQLQLSCNDFSQRTPVSFPRAENEASSQAAREPPFLIRQGLRMEAFRREPTCSARRKP